MVTSLVESVNRIIEESVPGKQVTIAHVIASPIPSIYESLGIEESGAIGILTLSPYVDIGFLDRFTGSVVIMGDVQSVETALKAVTEKLKTILQFDVVPVTKT